MPDFPGLSAGKGDEAYRGEQVDTPSGMIPFAKQKGGNGEQDREQDQPNPFPGIARHDADSRAHCGQEEWAAPQRKIESLRREFHRKAGEGEDLWKIGVGIFELVVKFTSLRGLWPPAMALVYLNCINF